MRHKLVSCFMAAGLLFAASEASASPRHLTPSDIRAIDDTADSLIVVATKAPDQLGKVPDQIVQSSLHDTAQLDDSGARHEALLAALWGAHYQPINPFYDTQNNWFELFSRYADRGETDKAAAVLASLTSADMTIRLRSEKRFTPYAAIKPAAFDFQAMADKDLAATRDQANRHADRIVFQHLLAARLEDFNRLDEALAVIDTALAKVEAAPSGHPPYSDLDDELHWMYDERSYILAKLGRNDEAIAAMSTARLRSMRFSYDTVSQQINLAGLYCDMGRPKDALSMLDHTPDNSNGYGMMVTRKIQACAYAELGDTSKLAKTLSYMRDHVSDSVEQYRQALVYGGDLDSLSSLILQQLEDPNTRNDALVFLQTYLIPPSKGAGDTLLATNRAALLARPEVQAAVTKYGVIESYPVYH